MQYTFLPESHIQESPLPTNQITAKFTKESIPITRNMVSTAYRPNVLAVFFKSISPCVWCSHISRDPLLLKCNDIDLHTRVLVGMRSDKRGWQFPQGGIDPLLDHSPKGALLREVKEELGLEPNEYEIKEMLNEKIYYDFDPFNLTPSFYNEYKGQEQYWFSCALNPSNNLISSARDSIYNHSHSFESIGDNNDKINMNSNDDYIPDLSKAEDDEFCELKWVSPKEAYDNIVLFKKEAYYQGLSKLGFL